MKKWPLPAQKSLVTETPQKPSRLFQIVDAVAKRARLLIDRNGVLRSIDQSGTDPIQGDGVQEIQRIRPEGLLLWVHAPDSDAATAAEWMISRLSDQLGEPVKLLVTLSESDPNEAPPASGVIRQPAPPERKDAVSAFFDHWRPDAGLVVGGDYRPFLLSAAHVRGIGLVSMNATVRGAAVPHRQQQSLVSSCSRYFRLTHDMDGSISRALAQDTTTTARIERGDVVLESPLALTANENDRATLSAMLSTRPVWLATNVTRGEIGPLVAAQSRIAKHTHRALLIASTTDVLAAQELARHAREMSWEVAVRSSAEEPEQDVQVYVADTDGEDGLWYRLASVSFLGNSLAAPGGGISPFPAAALGSVVLHGPHVGDHTQRYDRLSRAGAAHLVLTGEGLSREVQNFFQPDRAAQSAQAAWIELSQSAVQADRIMDVLCEILEVAEGM